MEFVLPLKIKKIEQKLPISLFNGDKLVVKIEKFSIKEKEWFFDLKKLILVIRNAILNLGD
ncbi:MAG: hypothetical protein P1P85_00840 [Patescibacteria group bacterium]|nr:hypothetical protein [Patescibacteria group bacterium]